LDERLARYIVEGSRDGLVDDLNEALKTRAPLAIINGPLMAGMDEVGRLFNNNELIVAEVLQSAEAMKAAVNHLEPFMEKADASSKGKILLATVKGDVHDIGKNLVEIILGNNGYRIVNLGIKVAPEALIEAYRREKPDAIGLSGLLVKSAQQMVVTAQDLKNAGIDAPILVGGAALSNRFTATKIAPEYSGVVLYAKDAMMGLDLANRLSNADERQTLIARIREEQRSLVAGSAPAKPVTAPAAPVAARSAVRRDAPVPPAPDFDRHVIRDAPLGEIFAYINPIMLYGKHLGLRGQIDKLLADKDEKAIKLHDAVEGLKREIMEQKLLSAHAVWRFFPCQSDGDDVIIYDPAQPDRVAERFHFPRQASGERLCLADYVRDTASGERDSVALFAVTCGVGVRGLSQRWKDAGEYLRSHALQAIAVEAAEGMAEWLHRRLRTAWGFPDPPTTTIHDVLKNKYRGIRVSFGYPACPNLADQRKLFSLIRPQDIGVELTDGDMMDPEASVSALVFHHPEAKYFRAD
jgi:5-methyltetrahydrofolate--homocysteine methyltransferase